MAELYDGAEGPVAGTDGRHIYIFGGETGTNSSEYIQRYDPVTDEIVVLDVRIRGSAREAPCVWTGTEFLIFGGRSDDTTLRSFNPETGVITHKTRIPVRRWRSAAIHLPPYVYLVGSVWDGDVIVRYDIGADAFKVMGARLPKPRVCAAATDGERIFILGGDGIEVLIYDIASDSIALAAPDERLSASFSESSFTGDGESVYMFKQDGSILRYHVPTRTGTTLKTKLPSPRSGTVAVWFGDSAYVIGGRDNATNRRFRDIWRFRPKGPGIPQNLVATPGAGEITLTWSAPDPTPEVVVKGYRVYAGRTAGHLSLLKELGDVLTFTHNGLPDGETRRYKVGAVSVEGEESGHSAEASATTFATPGAPLGLRAQPGPEKGEITLAWSRPEHADLVGITGYRVYAGAAPGEEAWLRDEGPDALIATEKDLPEGTLRYYRVSAFNETGEGPMSNGASAVVPTEPPTVPPPMGHALFLQEIKQELANHHKATRGIVNERADGLEAVVGLASEKVVEDLTPVIGGAADGAVTRIQQQIDDEVSGLRRHIDGTVARKAIVVRLVRAGVEDGTRLDGAWAFFASFSLDGVPIAPERVIVRVHASEVESSLGDPVEEGLYLLRFEVPPDAGAPGDTVPLTVQAWTEEGFTGKATTRIVLGVQGPEEPLPRLAATPAKQAEAQLFPRRDGGNA